MWNTCSSFCRTGPLWATSPLGFFFPFRLPLATKDVDGERERDTPAGYVDYTASRGKVEKKESGGARLANKGGRDIRTLLARKSR